MIKEEQLSNEEILTTIKNYIDKASYNYAVLIDGNWGSGKTFFVKNYLINELKEHNNKEKKIIYISLYGVTTTNEISKRIFIETIPFSEKLKSQGVKTVTGLGKFIASTIFTVKGTSIKNIEFSIEDFLKLKDCILIFDDLERCSMNINEVLGYINNFVEHENMKVIIVANEKEISLANIFLNTELKYLVALNNNIDMNKQNSEKNNMSYEKLFKKMLNDKKEKEHQEIESNLKENKVDHEELINRVQVLFGQNEFYSQIKEKLIGINIYYEPNIKLIVEELVGKTEYNSISKMVKSNKEFIVQKMQEYNHKNIRTLLFSLDKFQDLMNKLPLNSNMLERMEDKIFKYTIISSIIFKSGNKKIHEWKENEDIVEINLNRDMIYESRSITGFKFVDDFVVYSKFNKSSIDSIGQYIDRCDAELRKNKCLDKEDPLFKFNYIYWYSMEDKEALELINKLDNTLKSNPCKYEISSYYNILAINIILESVGVNTNNIDDIVNQMKNNIRNYIELSDIKNKYYVFGSQTYSFQNEKLQQKYNKYCNDLKKVFDERSTKEFNNKINVFFDKTDKWSADLLSYVSDEKNISEILTYKGFLSVIDFEKLLTCIKVSSNTQITEFTAVINCYIYNLGNIKDFLANDIYIIQKLINELEKYKNTLKGGKIRIYNINNLIEQLESISNRLR
ncbi:P-loop NTPase fold protein [Clostridium felsineum]|uniref:P-loop NTPase fold protein n=1 Tax=Clostridium felsineum TaxID=36839 RepID=UPI0009D210AB|nr:P-loop NTPase fold protein [Clostridium felsineum]URZ15787.1 hypothetical protein CLFE_018340 [Clostridium felsineum DSM 794]